jgi:hypothetical protein
MISGLDHFAPLPPSRGSWALQALWKLDVQGASCETKLKLRPEKKKPLENPSAGAWRKWESPALEINLFITPRRLSTEWNQHNFQKPSAWL